MATKNARIDDYISKSADFAKPILIHLRALIHKACPEVEETIKWGMPFFSYKGPLCNMASFKQHAVFGFWKGKLLDDPKGNLQERSIDGGSAMGNMGRITHIRDLPSNKAMLGLIKQAMKLNDAGVKLAAKPRAGKKELVIPMFFKTALNKNKKALKTFEEFSYSNKKEYVQWLVEAKTEVTKKRRVETAIVWLSEGKQRNWRHMK